MLHANTQVRPFLRHDFSQRVGPPAHDWRVRSIRRRRSCCHRDRPNQVTLEVTENVFVQDSARALIVLDDLKQFGVTLALEGFGIGYSPLSYLLHFPFDVVKIDRVFIAGLTAIPASRVIIKAAIGIAHDLNMTVIAEGVETSEQYEQLTVFGCDACQGYYLARPPPTDALEALLEESSLSDVTTTCGRPTYRFPPPGAPLQPWETAGSEPRTRPNDARPATPSRPSTVAPIVLGRRCRSAGHRVVVAATANWSCQRRKETHV